MFGVSGGRISGGTPVSIANVPNAPKQLPNPFGFELLDQFNYGCACVLIVRYPDCTNFEGKKVIVFNDSLENVLIKCLKDDKLDTHFFEGERIIARFAPTDDGILYAKEFAQSLDAKLSAVDFDKLLDEVM